MFGAFHHLIFESENADLGVNKLGGLDDRSIGTTDPDAVQKALIGIEFPNLTGGMAKMLPNHHISKPVLIGEIQDDGQFLTVWQTNTLVKGDAWSDFLPESKPIIADWTPPINCGNYNTETKKCSGQNY